MHEYNYILSLYELLKATFTFHKLNPKSTQIATLYTNWSLYITFTMIYYGQCFHIM